MVRRRVLLAIIPPPEIINAVRVLRGALGDDRPERIVPHMTIVPPSNIENGSFASLRRLVRSVSTRSEPFDLELTSVGSFHPGTPTLHLEVGGLGAGALEGIREALIGDGLLRIDARPYRPHLTILSRVDEPRLAAALDLLDPKSFEWIGAESWTVDAVQILEQYRNEERGTYWVPIIEEALGEPTIVGRGGVELVLRRTRVLEPDFVSMFSLDTQAFGDARELTIISAEAPRKVGQSLGVVIGTVEANSATILHMEVRDEDRGHGIGRQLLKQWCHEASRSGAQVAWARDCEGAGILRATGFVPVGELWVRELQRI